MKKSAFALTLLLAAANLFGGRIASVKFVQSGPSKLDESVLLMNIQSKTGTIYRVDSLDEDIKHLYSIGYFDDVRAEAKDNAAGETDITFHLKLKPLLRKVLIEGNAKFKTAELLKETTLAPNGPFSTAKLRESAQKLREFYRSKGYHQATVTPRVVEVDKDGKEMDAVFTVAEHLRLKVNNVTFEGNKAYGEGELKGVLANRHSFLSRFFEIGLYDEHELENDKLRLRDLYMNKGYLDFKVDEIKVTPDPEDPEYVDLHFVLSEGEPYTVGDITIRGSTEMKPEELLKFIPLESGGVYSLEKENAGKQRISRIYNGRGFIDFYCKVNRNADYATHKVDLVFELAEGRRQYVNKIIIKGNTATKEKVIRRELAIQPGDPIDRNRLDASKSRLMGMGYFQKVDINTVNADKLDEKNIEIKVDERRDFINFKIGGGFSDMNSLVGMIEASSNNFDITDPGNWFYGGGQRLRVRGIAGIDTYGFNVDFTEPWFLDRRIRFDLSGYMNEINYSKWDEVRTGVRTAITARIFDEFTSITGGYKFEQVNVRNMDDGVSQELLDQKGRQWVSQFSVMLDRDTRDNLIDPTSGYNINVLGAVSPKLAGSTENFYRLEAKGSYYYSFWDKAIVLMLGAKIGTVANFDRDKEVPLFERYFLGGGDSLRGFPYREVSPVDENGANVGGQSMLLITGEVSHPIWRFIRGAAFVDIGNAWADSYNYSLNKINIGAGYGLRIKLPYLNAPIRLDLAYPVLSNQEDLDKKLRFHFNMGFTFGR